MSDLLTKFRIEKSRINSQILGSYKESAKDPNVDAMSLKDFETCVEKANTANTPILFYTKQAIAEFSKASEDEINKAEESSKAELTKAAVGQITSLRPVYVGESILFVDCVDMEKNIFKSNAINDHFGRSGEELLKGEFESTPEDHQHKVGDTVRVPHNLTTDPNNKRGQVGKVGKTTSDTVHVHFGDGSTGYYQHDALERKTK